MSEPIVFTPSQKHGLKLLLEGENNVFLTGGPGTGKSFLIAEYLKEEMTEIPVIASTGAAAILLGGRTFHSFFGLGILQGGVEAAYKRALKNARLKSRLKKLTTVVIDEVSMLSIDAFNCAEKIARGLRGINKPWGGIRVIAVGDFAQLPPITKGPFKEWCFLGEAWARSRFEKVELVEVKRTEDREYLSVLEDIRWGKTTERVEAFLNDRLMGDVPLEADVPHIFPRRAETEAFNRSRLEEIAHPVQRYETEYGGEENYIERMRKDAPVPPVLELKKDALVMMRINDPKQRFVNGTIGKIVELSDFYLLVNIHGRDIEIDLFTFVMLDADGEEVAYAINFPVTLAYASTIHKIQGTTLERAHISLKSLWEPGQAYVALSRTRKVEGLTLMGWDRHSIKADPVVEQFYRGPVKEDA